jgi:hypothetical protein
VKDIHKGETCIAIANGPSLKDVPNEFLESYVTFGVNKIWLKEFAPTYYVATDNIMGQYLNPFMLRLKCREYFLNPKIRKHSSVGNPILHVTKDEGVVFSYDPLKWVSNGSGTVMFTVLHIAYLMGFSTVLMVGLDHSGNEHFHPSYDLFGMAGKTYTWVPKNVDRGYQVCLDAYEADGRRIINLTPDSKCDVFEKQDIELWQTHT